MTELTIAIEDPAAEDITALLSTHLAFMDRDTPDGSGHALNVDALRARDVTFWAARYESRLAGCVALKRSEDAAGEVKSMHTAEAFRGRGVARALLEALQAQAIRDGLRSLALETGKSESFEPSRRLYRRFGFEPCAPFGDYVDDPFSYCMRKAL